MGAFKTTRTETRDFNTETAAIRENCVRCFYSKFLRLKAKKKKMAEIFSDSYFRLFFAD